MHVLSKHEGPVFSLKWNQKGTLLLSCSLDGSAITWDVEKGKPKHQWLLHKSGCLDIDWRDERSFASCSSDKSIKVVNVDEEQEIKTFTGHKDEVNAIQWDPSGQMIASCSDDKTVRVSTTSLWRLDANHRSGPWKVAIRYRHSRTRKPYIRAAGARQAQVRQAIVLSPVHHGIIPCDFGM